MENVDVAWIREIHNKYEHVHPTIFLLLLILDFYIIVLNIGQLNIPHINWRQKYHNKCKTGEK